MDWDPIFRRHEDFNGRVTWGAVRSVLYNWTFRRHGLESLFELDADRQAVVVHASRWGSGRPLCGADNRKLRRSREQWGDEVPVRHAGPAAIYANALFPRCPRCLELEPVDIQP